MNLGEYIAKILLEQDEEQPLIKDETDEIERTAQELNMSVSDIKNAFNTGNIITLSNDVWSKLENSDSWDIKSLKDIMANKGKSSGKIMNFNDFDKKDFTTKVTKVKE